MNSGLGVGLKEVVEVVGCDGLLQLGEDLLRVRAIRLDEFLFLVLGFDVGFTFIPDEQNKGKLKVKTVNPRYLQDHLFTFAWQSNEQKIQSFFFSNFSFVEHGEKIELSGIAKKEKKISFLRKFQFY